MIETRRLKNVVIFIKKILSFVLSRKIKNRSNNQQWSKTEVRRERKYR